MSNRPNKCSQNESRPSEGQCQLQSRQSEVLCQNSRRSEGRPSGVTVAKITLLTMPIHLYAMINEKVYVKF